MFTKWSREYHSTVHFACTAPIQSCGGLYPAKTNLQDHARILQESCMQVLLGTCTRYVPFLARFLHNLAHILQEMRNGARFCKSCCKNIYLHIFCKILQELVQDCASIVQEKGHIACTSCMQDSWGRGVFS